MGLILCTVACAGIGCTATAPQRDAPQGVASEVAIEPTPPPRLAALVEDLIVYRARHGRFPRTLAALEANDATMSAYAYDGRGLANLADGRRILLVDAIVYESNLVWCIVRNRPSAAQTQRGPVLELMLRSIPDLERAAAKGE
ncbi:MAG: hypothetical protein ACODAQ_03060 [Phycisphaeraceae bacterium]